MKVKRWIALFLTGMLICGMAGCGVDTDEKSENKENVVQEESAVKQEESVQEKQEEVSQQTEKISEEDVTAEEIPAKDGEEFEYEGDAVSQYVDLYAPVIEKYYSAMKEEWDGEKLLQEEMSLYCLDYYGKDGLDQVGYGFMDLDGDGYWELLIGSGETIFDAYTYKSDSITQIFCGDPRNRYYISEDEAAGFFIANEASAGAMNSVWIYSQYDGTTLQIMQSILYDAQVDPENPWFMGADDDWDASNDSPVDEKFANDIIDSYSRYYVTPDYLSLRDYS